MADKTQTKYEKKGQNDACVPSRTLARALKSTTCDLSAVAIERDFVHNNEGIAGDFRPQLEVIPVPISSEVSCDFNESGERQIPGKKSPLSTQWISEELLLETRKLWSKAYKRVISNEEAIEILMNVKRVAEVLVKMQKENNSL
ncbi:MAG: hypothetical protein NTX52_04310 [Planctomycetota bacterium]|nr:hypothetical protein [Planctomycetota bacterium]